MNKTDEQIAADTDSKNQSAIKAFYELIKSHSCKGKEKGYNAPTNFVFFVGAGFSKAWDERFCGGKELFEKLPNENRLFIDSLECYLQTMSWCKSEMFNGDEFEIGFDDFKKIVFSLDMYEKHRELRPKYIDSNGIKTIREKLNALIAFKMWEHNPYLQGAYEGPDGSYNPSISTPEEILTERQKEIFDFFYTLRNLKNSNNQAPTKKQKEIASSLNALADLNNDSQWQERIRLNHITTNYDFVIECIYDICINEVGGESHLDFVYRGFTPNEYCDFKGIRKIKDHSLTEYLFKLNGGLEVYCNPDGTYRIDYREKECGDLKKESPLLILPSYEQDYSSPYFREILQKSKELLTVAKVLIIVGYSLPEEDILIRFLLKHFALDKSDFQDKKIFYINKGESHNKLRKKLKSVFREAINKSFSKQVYTFSGSFNDFVERFNQLWEPDVENAE